MSKKKVQEKIGVPTKGQMAEEESLKLRDETIRELEKRIQEKRIIIVDDKKVTIRQHHSITYYPCPEDDSMMIPEFGINFPATFSVKAEFFNEPIVTISVYDVLFYEGPLTDEMSALLEKNHPQYFKDLSFILSRTEENIDPENPGLYMSKFCSDGVWIQHLCIDPEDDD